LFAQFDLSLESRWDYNNNAFNLSDSELDQFDDGHTDFNYIESSDDLVTTNSARLRYTYEKKRVSYAISSRLGYNHYFNNNDKNSVSSYSALAYRSRKIDLNLGFGYYPDNYLRKYEDHDGTGELEEYSYDKTLYKFDGNYRLSRKNYLNYYAKYEQYFYNEYFTEQDGDAMTFGLGWRHSFPTFYLDLMYYYRLMETDNHIDNASGISDWESMKDYRDASYDANIFSIKFTNKRVRLTKKIELRPYISYTIEKRYYITDLPVSHPQAGSIDPIHSTREDSKYNLDLGVFFYLTKKLNISLDYTHIYRKVSSDYKPLADLKDYVKDSISVTFSYNLAF